ncbi:ABC transporter substrate-binding protein [Pseudomonas sp. C27(2019)]|uniref:substrate-binding periplasmic protein n=1 Tax=Pseudomonas sp. C27(2019) TaxID=2604941 RepID=UPI0015B39BB0|nr:transporter substrate-binding domain-containing protein [Pseudomonas sp. C27(2019)]
MRHLRAVLLIIGFFTHVAAIADSRPTITVGYYDFPPVSYTDKQGTPQGSFVQLCRTLLTSKGYRVIFKDLPSARLYANIISGDIDIWLGAPGKPALAGHVLESSLYLGEASLALFYHPDAPAPKLPNDLKDKKIILINGYSYWPPATQWLADNALNLQVTRTSQHSSAIAMLMRKRGDYLLDYLSPIQAAQQELGINGLRLPYILINSTPLAFVISRKSAQPEQLLKDLEQAYTSYKARPLH